MNSNMDESMLLPPDLPTSLLPVVPAAITGTAASGASECLYQLAALTVGAFLLATMI
jgi:hypothetical protein